MLNKELLDKIGSLVKIENHNKYIDEEDLRFLYNDVNLSCVIFKLLNKNNIEIRRIRKDSTKLREIILEYQKNNNTDLRDEVLYDCLYFIYRISYKMSIVYNTSMEELVSYGYEGLMHGVNTYDKEKNYNIIAYISQNIYYSIARHISNQNNNDYKLISIEEINNIERYDIDDCINEFSDKQILEIVFNKLSFIERKVVELYYGFNDNKEHTLNEIAKLYNYSMESIRLILRRSLKRIKNNYLAEEKNVYIKKR